MNTASKIKLLQRIPASEAEEASFNLGMVEGLKKTIRPDFDYDVELIGASDSMKTLLREKQGKEKELALEKAVGYYSGLVYSVVEDIFEAQASGYQELHLLRRQVVQDVVC
jgi:hypothetical protein